MGHLNRSASSWALAMVGSKGAASLGVFRDSLLDQGKAPVSEGLGSRREDLHGARWLTGCGGSQVPGATQK